MEKQTQTKHKNKIMRFLPKATSAVTFQNPPPATDKRSSEINNTSKYKSQASRKGFSGQIISIIPAEARGKAKNGSTFDNSQEPTSPKVSCMGTIKHKKKLHDMKRRVASTSKTQAQTQTRTETQQPTKELKKQTSTLRKIFGRTKYIEGRKSDATSDRQTKVLPQIQRAPSLGQMRRFASGRDTFANFDWTAQIAPVNSDHPDTFTDDEDSGDEDEVKIPFSAPIYISAEDYKFDLEPRKEINLWKRRTMNPPRPLQVNTLFK